MSVFQFRGKNSFLLNRRCELVSGDASLSLEDVEGLVDHALGKSLGSGQDPSVFDFPESEEELLVAVNDGDLGVVGVENIVVSSGLKGVELDAETSRHVEVLDNSITVGCLPPVLIG